MVKKEDNDFGNRIKLLLGGFLFLTGIFLPNLSYAQDSPNQITIEGKDRSPPRVSFQYTSQSETTALQFNSRDVPEQLNISSFEEPSLEKDATRTPHPRFLRANRTAVQEYSLLELIGIGAGAFALLLVL